MNKKILIGVLVIVGLLIFASVRTYNYYKISQNQNVVEEQPSDDKSSEETISNKNNLIRVEKPTSEQIVNNPISVKGEARGYWFFEGSFSIIVVDWDGRIIGQGYATAQDAWMTEEFVSFTGEVTYDLSDDTPYKNGTIIFRKDNPSGLPENDDAYEVPIRFK